MSPTICFKRWSRKNFAVFASLHRVIKIGVVTFSCSLVQERYQPVFAQMDTGTHAKEEATLDEVEVSASQPLPWTAMPFSTSTIEQKDIAAAPAATLEDVLEYLPGVDVRQRGPDGVQADISLNGGSFDQVLILLNGVNITDPQTGHFNLDIPIDLSQVKRIEVLRGSATGILGSNAFSGAINLITTEPSGKKRLSGKVDLGAGNFHRRQGGSELSFSTDRLSLLGAGSVKSSNGYQSNTDYRMVNGNVQAAYLHPTLGKWLFQAGYRQKDFGANSFYSLSYPRQFEATTTLYSALTWDASVGKSYLQVQAYQRRHHDRFELFRDGIDAASWYKGHNYHLTDVTGGKLTVTSSSESHYGLIGVEFRNEHIYSNVLGKDLSSFIHDPLDASALFTKAENRSTLSGIVHQRIRLGMGTTSLGVTLNYTPGIGAYWQGGLDGSYRVNEEATASINLNRSLRLPTFTDLYYQSATQRSNPTLRPEQAVTLEGRLEWKRGETELSLNGFHRWGIGLIDWIKRPDSVKWESSNLTAIQTTGGSIEAGLRPKTGLLSSLVADYTFLYLNKTANGFDSKYALDYLRHKVDVKASGRLLENRRTGLVSAYLDAGYYDRSGTYSVPGSTDLKGYKPYWLVDARIRWSQKRLSLYADVCNVFNLDYTDYGGLSQPGRNFRTGVTVSF